jgi:hypothetical protein
VSAIGCVPTEHQRCSRFEPGHNLHWELAGYIAWTPWGWRNAVVTATGWPGLEVHYLDGDHPVELWHHADLALPLGAPVRVHEGGGAVAGPFGWASVEVGGGLGPVDDPADPEVWRAELVRPVLDLRSGYVTPKPV